MASGSGPSASGTTGLHPGVVLDGKYEIVGLLGSGGMGEVWKARHVHLGAFRCIKVMKPGVLADDTYRGRFLREARLATQIHHVNLAVVHDFSLLDSGLAYMVAEFIDGTTIRQWANANGRFPVPLAAAVAVQVLSGLDHIHRRGMLHRDISGDNVMLAYDADDHLVAKIIDLGVAKDFTATADTTQTGVIIGNPKYMSPEQLGELPEGEQIDGRADIYCFGVVLYEMLLGVPPFVARTPNGYIIKHLMQPPPPFREADPSLSWPAGLEDVVFKALEKDRRRRYPTAREFAEALGPFLDRSAAAFTRSAVNELVRQTESIPAKTLPDVDVTSGATTGALSAEESFRAAWEEGTVAAWQRFLAAFPDSEPAARARECLAEADSFASAWRSESETAVREFLHAWPAGRHQLEAEIRLGELKQRRREAERSEEEARDRRSWEEAGRARTPAAVQAYLQARPEGRFAGEARSLIAQLDEEARRREPADFDRAWERGTTAAWDDYLAWHPQSPRLAEVRRWREEAAEFEMAVSMDTPAIWRAFIKAWPDGRHRLDAEVRLPD
ncbi:MAG TPA: serine/threonine-protein kinase [Thermoanaerobaculia bacterium]|nr:serine/threonine-protein kinase [Thermoanaerobaculia bacterium]